MKGSTTTKKSSAAAAKKMHSKTAERVAGHVPLDKAARIQALAEDYFESELVQTELLFSQTSVHDPSDPKYTSRVAYAARAKAAQMDLLTKIARATAGAVNGQNRNLKEESELAKDLVAQARARLEKRALINPKIRKPEDLERHAEEDEDSGDE